MNPEAPVHSENYGTERDISNCPFFLKTGSCRFGDRCLFFLTLGCATIIQCWTAGKQQTNVSEFSALVHICEYRCSRKHVYPAVSPTLMIRSMFKTFGMEESRRDDYDIDACLEHSEEELYESFLEFYHDVLPEFKSVGKVLQFKVGQAWHLIMLIYRTPNSSTSEFNSPQTLIRCSVPFRSAAIMNHTWEETFMFSLKRKPSNCCKALSNLSSVWTGLMCFCVFREEQCKEAFIKFNGRWYAGRQLHCEMCPVTRWKNAICGQLLLLHYTWAPCTAHALVFTTFPMFSGPLRSVWQTEVS